MKMSKEKSPGQLQYRQVLFLTDFWNQRSQEYIEKQTANPFSGRYTEAKRPRWIKGSKEYAKPVGKTAERGERAHKYILSQLDMLCYVIGTMGQSDRRGCTYTTFGELFQRYTKISSNVVGLLIRARRRHLLDFPGEMLWQRRDDDVIITLNKILSARYKPL